FRTSLERDPATNYLLRNTVSLTMFKGSEQTNVIPGVVTANIDVRLLPGEDPQQFLTEIRQVGEEPNVTIEPQSGFRLANSSSTSTALYAAFRNVAAHYFPGAPVVPHMTSGYNENQLYRPLGISGYGFSPYTATAEESSTEHGNNERIRVEEVRRGFRVLYDVVSQVATASQSR
ncbi:MAG TPA: peptidase dimerization domain-containing protein, partial [Terriglobales bacterium]|nr:peptidase dimerization domain-containing protein [Terriglobales bacterium]